MIKARSVVEHDDPFGRGLREQWTDQLGRRLDVLVAGCGWSAPLATGQMETKVTGVDEDRPALRARTESRDDLDAFALGDLRSVPLTPRSFDVVMVEHALERIRHAELVLDRLVAALRPGGLLLVRMRDRESAYGIWTRRTPSPLRRLVWRRFTPAGSVGPLPAVYEPVTSREGMRSYCLSRGLRISEERARVSGPALAGSFGVLGRLACRLLQRVSGGRHTAAHDELVFVIRKPQNQFARLI